MGIIARELEVPATSSLVLGILGTNSKRVRVSCRRGNHVFQYGWRLSLHGKDFAVKVYINAGVHKSLYMRIYE